MRYAGQGYEITIPCEFPLNAGSIAKLRKQFDQSHQQMFGHTAPEEPVEIVSYRLRGIGRVPPVEIPSTAPKGARSKMPCAKPAKRASTASPSTARSISASASMWGHVSPAPPSSTSSMPPRSFRPAEPRASTSSRTSSSGARDDEERSALGAVDLEIIKASLSGIVQEMQNSLFRTGFSTIVRESQDASCAILDTNADVIAQHVVLPLHMGAFPACCGAVIKAYGGDIVEGDAYLINHPYEGGSPHAPDMAVITPIFVAGELIGFCGSIAHKSDIGGPVPGSCSGQAKEIFNEGLHLPAVRYFRGGQRNVEIERIIAANSRTPELVLGDIRGQLGASRLGEQRVAELVGKFGKANALASFQRLLDLAEKKMRTAISEWVDGRFEAETLHRRRRHRAQQARAHPCGRREEGRHDPLRFFRLRGPDQGARQCAPASGQGGRRLCADLAGRSADLHQ